MYIDFYDDVLIFYLQKLDGFDLRQLNLQWLRSHIAIVSQEPVLFDCSIKDNIIYGIPDDERDEVTMEQVEEAAKSANIHHFISTLPQVGNSRFQNHYLKTELTELTAC